MGSGRGVPEPLVPAQRIDKRLPLERGWVNGDARLYADMTGTPAKRAIQQNVPALDIGLTAEGAPTAWLRFPVWFAPARCDRVYDGKNARPGCVTPYGAPPVLTVPKTDKYKPYRNHIVKAQASGLPSLLTRATPAQEKANRRVACQKKNIGTRPAPVHDDPWDCDEYPFASTAEGAAKSPGGRRTFKGCQMPGRTNVKGRYGYSECYIPHSSNAAGGRQLLGFYQAQRIMPGDQYKLIPAK